MRALWTLPGYLIAGFIAHNLEWIPYLTLLAAILWVDVASRMAEKRS